MVREAERGARVSLRNQRDVSDVRLGQFHYAVQVLASARVPLHVVTHPTVKRAKVTVHSTDLCCQVRRAVGWSAECACGQRFPIRRDPDDAKRDARVHTATCRR